MTYKEVDTLALVFFLQTKLTNWDPAAVRLVLTRASITVTPIYLSTWPGKSLKILCRKFSLVRMCISCRK